MSDVKEHPMAFTAEMVRAILDGRKTQTRRPVTKQNSVASCRYDDLVFDASVRSDHLDPTYRYLHVPHTDGETVWRVYSRIEPGDRLWAREAWAVGIGYDSLKPSEIPPDEYIKRHYLADGPKPEWCGRTRNARFIPRHFSRIDLDVTAVRVERVQDISEADALAEGVTPTEITTPRDEFSELWDRVHGDGAWEKNDWVWVREFTKVA